MITQALQNWKKSTALRALLLFSGVCALGGILVVRLFPLQMRGSLDDYRAWRLGLRPIASSSGLAGRVLGEGPECLILVHGIGDTEVTWQRFIPLLKKSQELASWRVIAWDLPGHGRSFRPEPTAEGTAELRPRRMADRLWRATQEAGCSEKSLWVGNSLGGWVTAWVGLEHPGAVRGVVLLAPAGLRSQAQHPKMPSPAGLLENPTLESIQEFRARAHAKPQESYPDWVWRAALERIQASAIRRTRSAVTLEDTLDERLSGLRVPAVFIWGKQDRILPLEASQDFKTLPPSSSTSFREVDACGHLPQKECPEAVITALEDLLRYGAF